MKSVILLALTLLIPAMSAQAAESELYVGFVPVADQSSAARQDAMPRALAQVLQKLTGLGTFEESPQVAAATEQASAIAVSFYYRNQPVDLPDGSIREQLELVVHFSPRAVDELVRELQLPLWNPERRPLTVWLLVDDDLGRRVMPIELEYAWQRMQKVADNRGLPISRPRPGPDDSYPVDIQILWGGFTEELADEGPADALIIAALREGPEWNLRLNLDYGEERWTWRERGIDLLELLTGVIHRAADEIAASTSIAAIDIGRWNQQITVRGVASADDYVRSMNYLLGLSVVEDIEVVAAAPGSLVLDLELSALPSYLLSALAQGGVMQAAGEEHIWLLAHSAPENAEADGRENASPVNEPLEKNE